MDDGMIDRSQAELMDVVNDEKGMLFEWAVVIVWTFASHFC